VLQARERRDRQPVGCPVCVEVAIVGCDGTGDRATCAPVHRQLSLTRLEYEPLKVTAHEGRVAIAVHRPEAAIPIVTAALDRTHDSMCDRPSERSTVDDSTGGQHNTEQ
jgi:hypothetical protein